MLQHVLKEMRIDPELLEGLEDFEKEKLFCRMRGEQIRRWKEWDQKEMEAMKNQTPRIKHIGGKSVKWLCDDSGEPVVSVIHRPSGDDVTDTSEKDTRSNDQDYEQKELRLTTKDGRCTDLNTNETAHAHKFSKYVNVVSNNNRNTSSPSVILNFVDKRGTLQELSLNKVPKVARQVAEWEKRVNQDDSKTLNKTTPVGLSNSMCNNNRSDDSRDTNNIVGGRRNSESSPATEMRQEQLWREQQKIANETELRIRTIARLAREEHRRMLMIEKQNKINNNQNSTTTINSSIGDIKKNILKPTSNEAILNWFRTKELPRNANLRTNDKTADWFHGLISRKEAEDSLSDEKEGTFLVRIAERLWSYTISYKTSQGIKHFPIDASNGNYYQLLVNDQINHLSLNDLVSYYKTHPLTANGEEFLLYPCLKNRNVSVLFVTNR